MIYTLENNNTVIFFKIVYEEVAEALDTLLVTANLLGIEVDYYDYSDDHRVPHVDSAIVFDQIQKMEFKLSPTGHLSSIDVFDYKHHIDTYNHGKLLDGINMMVSILKPEVKKK